MCTDQATGELGRTTEHGWIHFKETWRILLSGHGGPFGFCRKKQKTQNVITNMC